MAGESIPFALAVLAQFRWDVSPQIVQIGPFPIHWYSFGWILAFGCGFLLVQWMYRKEGKPEKDLDTILLYMILGAIIGARLGHCFFYRPGYYLQNPIEILAFWKGFRGLASHGGTLGILASLFIFCRRHPDQPYLWLLDRIAAPTALGGMFIRLGNLMNSEILGVPTDAPWGVVFARVDSVARHPAQLYEAVAYGVTFLLLFTMYKKRGADLPRGALTGLFFVCVFGARFFIEFIKERHTPLTDGLPLSMGQILSIPLVVLGLTVVGLAWRKGFKTSIGS